MLEITIRRFECDDKTEVIGSYRLSDAPARSDF